MDNIIIIEIILGALTVMGFIAFCVLIMITIWEWFVESQVKRIICHFNNEAWRAQEFTERDLWILNSDFDCEGAQCESVCLNCAYAETKWQEHLNEKNKEIANET